MTSLITLAFAYVGLTSLIAFVLAVMDKSRARRGQRRIPERTLLGAAFIGGSPGLLAAMLMVRHKTRKASFLAAFAVIIILQLALLVSLEKR